MSFSYKYPRPALTVDAAVVAEGKILLIQRKNPPFKDKWALPGGFVDMDETVEQAVVRELFEETNIKLEKLQQLKTYSAVDRDPRGRTVSVVFVAKLETIQQPKAQDDASDAQWFSLNNLPPLAFDHKMILKEIVAAKELPC